MEIKTVNDFTLSLFKELVLPVIKKEVNIGKNFSVLRQIYHALILAFWFKKNVNFKNQLGLKQLTMLIQLMKHLKLRKTENSTESNN